MHGRHTTKNAKKILRVILPNTVTAHRDIRTGRGRKMALPLAKEDAYVNIPKGLKIYHI